MEDAMNKIHDLQLKQEDDQVENTRQINKLSNENHESQKEHRELWDRNRTLENRHRDLSTFMRGSVSRDQFQRASNGTDFKQDAVRVASIVLIVFGLLFLTGRFHSGA